MGTIRTLDPDAGLRDTIQFLASCEHEFPKDWKEFAAEFDRHSRKKIITLYREKHFKEIKIYQDSDTGVAVRDAMTSRAIIRNPTQKKFIIEMSRTYEDGETVPNYPGYPDVIPLEMWSISETMQKGEDPLKTLLRGMQDEMGFKPDNIMPRETVRVGITLPAFDDFHPSSVYKGVWTRKTTFWHTVQTHQFSSSFKLPRKRDNSVLLNWEWVDEL
ncbi:MAG: hypothetical protein JWM39_586 [Parcubacteria group bacterium]|nr:hypothetical protein [Parcubacteria group bacterium]